MREESAASFTVLKPLLTKSTVRWMSSVILDWSVIVAMFILAAHLDAWWMYLIAIVVIGTRQHALAILGHEGTHHLVSSNRTCNDWLTMLFCMWPIFSSLDGYRHIHLKHHQYIGTPNDPEQVARYQARPYWDIPIMPHSLALRTLIDLTGIGFVLYLRTMFARIRESNQSNTAHARDYSLYWRKTNRTRFYGMFAFWILIVGLLWSQGYLWMLWMWLAAMVTSFFTVARLRTWTEHIGTAGTHRLHASLLVRALFLPHYTWLHYEHHYAPSIPMWNLRSLRPKLHPEHAVIGVLTLFRSYAIAKPVPSGKATASMQLARENTIWQD